MVDGKPWKTPIDFRDILFEILRGYELFWEDDLKKKTDRWSIHVIVIAWGAAVSNNTFTAVEAQNPVTHKR